MQRSKPTAGCGFPAQSTLSAWHGHRKRAATYIGIPEEEQKAFFAAMGQTAEQSFPLRCSALPGLVDGELTVWAGSRQQELLDGLEMLRAQIRKSETPD